MAGAIFSGSATAWATEKHAWRGMPTPAPIRTVKPYTRLVEVSWSIMYMRAEPSTTQQITHQIPRHVVAQLGHQGAVGEGEDYYDNSQGEQPQGDIEWAVAARELEEHG